MTGSLTAHISAPALRNNLNIVHERAPGCRVMAVIKADGYGHGAVNVARLLVDADALAVARVDEGIFLRRQGISAQLVVLGGFIDADEARACAEYDLQPTVHHPDQARVLTDDLSGQVSVWLKVDSGMGRLGLLGEAVPAVIRSLSAADSVSRIQGIMTHLGRADEPRELQNREQIFQFEQLLGDWHGDISIANSAAILTEEDTLSPARALPDGADNWVRPGIMLYGASPFNDIAARDLGLQPVMELRAPLISVRHLPRGTSVGYGADWRADRDSLIGVVAVGYGDGYPRALGNQGQVVIRGRKVPVVGRVSMDSISIDLTEVADAEIGDDVMLWGSDWPVEEVARQVGTISYEILCGVAQRVRRQVQEA